MPADFADPMAEHKRRARWRLLGAVLFSIAAAAVVLMLFEDTPRSLKQDFILKWPAPPLTQESTQAPAMESQQEPAKQPQQESQPEPARERAQTAPAEPPTAPPKSKPYFLQLGAYSQKSSAEAARKKLEAPGRRLVVVSLEGSSGPRHRLRMGPFASEREADAARARLKLEGVEATLIRPEAARD
jgi:DedD protein